jgi:hypothetical protein
MTIDSDRELPDTLRAVRYLLHKLQRARRVRITSAREAVA